MKPGLAKRLTHLLLGGLPRRRNGPPSPESVWRVLLVKEPYRLGDMLLATPTFRALKGAFPHWELDLVLRRRNLEAVRSNPQLDWFYVHRKGGPITSLRSLVGIIRAVRRVRYDLVVTLESQKCHLTNDLIAALSRGRWRMRYDGAALGCPWANGGYDQLVSFETAGRHQVEKYAGVFEPYGLTLDGAELEFQPSPSAREEAIRVEADLGGGPMVFLHPGAGKTSNRWPLEQFVALYRVLETAGQRGAFLLGPGEDRMEGRLTRRLGRSPRCLAGIDLDVIGAVLERADALVCNDTGIAHLAAAVGCPTVVLFGPTDPLEWAPPGDDVEIIQAPEGDLKRLTVEAVQDALRAVLEGAPTEAPEL